MSAAPGRPQQARTAGEAEGTPVHAGAEPYDVAVVGLGALGSAIVRPLAQRGARVLGLDRQLPDADGAAPPGGLRSTRLAIGEGDAYVPLVRRSHAIWRELERQTGQPLYQATGGLVLGSERSRRTRQGKTDFLHRSIASAQSHGIAHALLDAREIRRRFPPFALQGDEIGFWEPDAGLLRPRAGIAAQLAVARASGARLRLGETVLGLEPRGDGSITLATDRGRYCARQVVLAAGAQLPELLQSQGGGLWADWQCAFTAEQTRTHWFAVPPEAAPAFSPDRFPVFVWTHGEAGEDCLHGMPSAVGAQPALRITAGHGAAAPPPAQDAAALLAARLPQLDPRSLHQCTRTRLVPRGRDFVVDRLDAGLPVWVASVHADHGFKYAPGLGEAIALKLLDVGTGQLLAAFGRQPAAQVQTVSNR